MKLIELKTNNPSSIIAIVANKVDLPARSVTKEDVMELAESIGAIAVETSAKSGQGKTVKSFQTKKMINVFSVSIGIDELFEKITAIMASGNLTAVNDSTVYVTSQNHTQSKSCC